MASFLARLLEVRHPDADAQRRGRNVIIITIGVIAMSLASIPLVLIQPDPGPQLVGPVVGSLINLGLILLARMGKVTAAAAGVVALLMLGLTLTPLASRQVGLVPQFMLVAVLIASVTARPWLVALTTVAAVGAIGLVGGALAGDPQKLPGTGEVLAVGAILAVMTGLLGALGAASTTRALREAREARERAEHAATALDEANRDLERRVAERTAALQAALAESERREAEQARLLAQVEDQRLQIRAMSVPVLPVTSGALVMPLVGSLDDERLQLVREEALAAVGRTRAKRLLLDVTGVPLIDTHVAQGLIRVVRSVRLLGAEAVLIGVRAEVAEALVSLGLDLSSLRTERDLRQALRLSSTS